MMEGITVERLEEHLYWLVAQRERQLAALNAAIETTQLLIAAAKGERPLPAEREKDAQAQQ